MQSTPTTSGARTTPSAWPTLTAIRLPTLTLPGGRLFVAPRHQEYISNQRRVYGRFHGTCSPASLATTTPSRWWRGITRASPGRSTVSATRRRRSRKPHLGGHSLPQLLQRGEAVGLKFADYVLDNFLLPLGAETRNDPY